MIRSISKRIVTGPKRSTMERDLEAGAAHERFRVWDREKVKRAETNKKLLRAATLTFLPQQKDAGVASFEEPNEEQQEADDAAFLREFFANFLLVRNPNIGKIRRGLMREWMKIIPPVFNRKSVQKPNARRMELHFNRLGRKIQAGSDAQAMDKIAALKRHKETLEDMFLIRATLQPADLLSGKLHAARDQNIDSASVFATTTPIIAALSKQRFQVMLLVAGAVFFGLGASAGLIIESTWTSEYGRFRFTALGLRDGNSEPSHHNIASLGLLKAGCQVAVGDDVMLSEDGASLTMELPSGVDFNGWSFTTSNASVDYDPVRFKFEAAPFGSDAWSELGGSSWRFTASGGRLFLNRFFETTTRRNTTVEFDMRPPWYWTTGRVIPDMIIAMMLIIVAGCGHVSQLQVGRAVFGNMWVLAGSVWVASAIGEHIDGQTNFSFWWYVSLGCFVIYMTVWFFEAYFIQLILCLCGLGCLFVAVLEYVIVQWNPNGFAITLATGVVLNLLAFALVLLRIKAIASAAYLIQPDEIAYAAAWERVLEKNSNPEDFVVPTGRYFENVEVLLKMTREEELMMREGRTPQTAKPAANSRRQQRLQKRADLRLFDLRRAGTLSTESLRAASNRAGSMASMASLTHKGRIESEKQQGSYMTPPKGVERLSSALPDMLTPVSNTGAKLMRVRGGMAAWSSMIVGSSSWAQQQSQSSVEEVRRDGILPPESWREFEHRGSIKMPRIVYSSSRVMPTTITRNMNMSAGSMNMTVLEGGHSGGILNRSGGSRSLLGNVELGGGSILDRSGSQKRLGSVECSSMPWGTSSRDRLGKPIILNTLSRGMSMDEILEGHGRKDFGQAMTPTSLGSSLDFSHRGRFDSVFTEAGGSNVIKRVPDVKVSAATLSEFYRSKIDSSASAIVRTQSTAKLFSTDDRVSPLLELTRMCDRIVPRTTIDGAYQKPLQVNRRSPDTPGLLDYSKPLLNMDQLFAQARALDPFLREKAKSWAVKSAGLFPMERSLTHFALKRGEEIKKQELPEFVAWSDALLDPILMRRIKWGRVKNPERAIEKALRSYHGNVCELLDVCRKSIYFDKVVDLMQCIKAITSDPDVVLERVKNRLDPDYDPEISAGYRDVALNLRIVNNDTKRMGVETHVCELQLILIEYAMLKHDAGHKRYVNFRNYLGE